MAPAVARDRNEPSPCLAGDLCIGPVLSLGVVNAFGIGAHVRYARYWGLGFDYQATPHIGGEALNVGTSSINAGLRVYPLGNGLFVSAGVGRQNVRVHVVQDGIGVDARAELSGLHFGLGWMGGSGLVVGIDATVLVPLGQADVSLVGVSGAPAGVPYALVRKEAEDRANAIARSVPVVPQLNILRVGYLF